MEFDMNFYNSGNGKTFCDVPINYKGKWGGFLIFDREGGFGSFNDLFHLKGINV